MSYLELLPETTLKDIVLHLSETELLNLRKVITSHYIDKRIIDLEEKNIQYWSSLFHDNIKDKVIKERESHMLGLYLDSYRWPNYLIDQTRDIIEKADKLLLLFHLIGVSKSQNILIKNYNTYIDSVLKLRY
tara:strand:+ start:36906 stop:37301 length:396 start_codon:yes stop_codon:yes gene_type:complete